MSDLEILIEIVTAVSTLIRQIFYNIKSTLAKDPITS